MYKRRDWLLLHGPDGGDSSSDEESEAEDSDNEREREHSDSSDGSAEDTGYESDKEEDDSEEEEEAADGEDDDPLLYSEAGKIRRLEDLSEDDFEQDDSEDEADSEDLDSRAKKETLANQVSSWLDTGSTKRVPGKPLRCIVCPKSLLLNPNALQSHLRSAKHLRKLQHLDEQGRPEDYLIFAEDMMPEEEQAETHGERLERMRAVRAKTADGAGKRRRKRTGSKPGKRQRQEAAAKAAAAESTEQPPKHARKGEKGRKKVEPHRGTKKSVPDKPMPDMRRKNLTSKGEDAKPELAAALKAAAGCSQGHEKKKVRAGNDRVGDPKLARKRSHAGDKRKRRIN